MFKLSQLEEEHIDEGQYDEKYLGVSSYLDDLRWHGIPPFKRQAGLAIFVLAFALTQRLGSWFVLLFTQNRLELCQIMSTIRSGAKIIS